MESLKNSNLGQAWLVLLLSIVFSISLASVQLSLNPVIEENRTKETMEKIPVLIAGKASAENSGSIDISKRIINVDKYGIAKSYTVYDVFSKSGTDLGHVVRASGQGYGDKIELLVGLDPLGRTITGLFILDQKETPGLGNGIVEAAWRDQFIGKSTAEPLVVVKGKSANDNEIDAVSGATISSRSVTDIVNTAISDVKNKIALVPDSHNKMENK